ncbi:MAG: GNAT family N-acetyltransferase [Micrococcaceae bacterium]|nr:GNAT family N-acetyltransferase [Micrococcaceae bacterium]
MATTIRSYEPQDAQATLSIFQHAVRTTAAADYSPEQIAAWTAGDGVQAWESRREATDTWIAEQNGVIVGFSDLDGTGYIDMMFVHPASCRTGVASALLDHIRNLAAERGIGELTVNASITARVFFERHGFTVQATQQIELSAVKLTNYRMIAPVDTSAATRWLPLGFVHPVHVEWGEGVHLRPIRASDVDIDMPAVMGSQEMLWEMFGEAWGWPPATMTAEQDVEDLQRHADEMERHESFNYAILPADETELYGCIYIDPVNTGDSSCVEAEVAWWVTASAPAWLAVRLGDLALVWLREEWPFTHVRTPFNQVRFRETR